MQEHMIMQIHTLCCRMGLNIFKRKNSNLLKLKQNNFKKLKFSDYFNNHEKFMNLINHKDIDKIFRI